MLESLFYEPIKIMVGKSVGVQWKMESTDIEKYTPVEYQVYDMHIQLFDVKLSKDPKVLAERLGHHNSNINFWISTTPPPPDYAHNLQ